MQGKPGSFFIRECVDIAYPRGEIIVSIFGNEAIFDSDSVKGDILLGVAQRFAKPRSDLFGDKVDAAFAVYA